VAGQLGTQLLGAALAMAATLTSHFTALLCPERLFPLSKRFFNQLSESCEIYNE